MSERVAIRLTKPWNGMRVGHVLTLVPVPAAKVYVDQGRAEYVVETPKVEPEKPKRKRKKKGEEPATVEPPEDEPLAEG